MFTPVRAATFPMKSPSWAILHPSLASASSINLPVWWKVKPNLEGEEGFFLTGDRESLKLLQSVADFQAIALSDDEEALRRLREDMRTLLRG